MFSIISRNSKKLSLRRPPPIMLLSPTNDLLVCFVGSPWEWLATSIARLLTLISSTFRWLVVDPHPSLPTQAHLAFAILESAKKT